MMITTPNFHFNGQCKKAIMLYEKAFGAVVSKLLCYSDANPLDWSNAHQNADDLVYHAELMLGNQRVFMSDSTERNIPEGNPLSLVITFDTADDVKTAYAVLSEGAEIISPMHSSTYSSCFVSLIDRFGMRWELMTEQTEN